MRTKNTTPFAALRLKTFILFGVFLMLAAVVAVPFYSAQSSSLTATRSVTAKTRLGTGGLGLIAASAKGSRFGSFLPVPAPAAESVTILAADCETPKTVFFLGETVCARADGVTETGRWLNWLSPPDSEVAHGGPTETLITTDPQFFQYTPTVDGLWKATTADATDSSITPAEFTVITQTAPIATYAAGCVTPQTTFELGEVVCARAIVSATGNYRFGWADPEGFYRSLTPITSNPQTDEFTLPTDPTTTIQGEFVVENRGTWRANVITSRGSVQASAFFTVQDADNAAHDLSVFITALTSEATEGSQVQYSITVRNNGPDAAANVHVIDDTFVNATLNPPVTQTGGTENAFVCAPGSIMDCSIASFPAGAEAEFLLNFTAGQEGSTIDNKARVTSDPTELNPEDDESLAQPIHIGDGGSPTSCVLECPNNMTVSANTTQGGNPGANVTFGNAEAFGTCGTVSMTPASGSFFSVAGSPHVVSASSTQGSGNCSFTITVIESDPPTITCPANMTVAANPGQNSAFVPDPDGSSSNVGNPTVTGSGVTYQGFRDDEESLSAAYPVGTTTIQWIATDNGGRQATCDQTITVTSPDAPTISCPSNKTFNSSNGCTYTATAAEIGTPTTTGPNVTVTSERSDGLALTDPYPAGVTFIEWTATNSVGSASCNQSITVVGNDTEDPTLNVPPSITTSTDQCSVQLDDEQFVATAEDNCSSSVNISRTGMPQIACPVPGNPNRTCDSFEFPTGTTVITYTATDSAGNSTTGTQTVTVAENPAIPPSIDAPANLTVYTGPESTSCGTFVGDATLGTATASDNCPGVTVSRSGVPAGNNFPVGTTTVVYTATDRAGNTAQDSQTVTVIDNTPPVISCPANITQNTDPGLCSAIVNPGTATATDNCDSNPTIVGTRSDSQPLNAPYPKGTTTITWTATDHASPTPNQSSCVQTITVEDNEAPVITTNGLTPSLWPANHAYHTFTVAQFVTAVSDNCDALTVSNVVIEKVTSDETENGGGDGNTFNDMIIAADCKSVQLRAERRNSGNGRVYTIHFKVTDSSGNVGTKTSKVHAPKNLGNGTVDDGPNYTVNGSCP